MLDAKTKQLSGFLTVYSDVKVVQEGTGGKTSTSSVCGALRMLRVRSRLINF